jgi:hypothetical protein
MATTTLKSPRIKGYKETQAYIRDYVFQAKYGMSYDEFVEKAENTLTERLLEKTNVIAAEQAKIMAAAAQQIEQSITTMFKKTGWSAEKIADISGFSLEMVQKTLDALK